ncbi:MAG: PAS domain-containing protein [Phormidium sp.]
MVKSKTESLEIEGVSTLKTTQGLLETIIDDLPFPIWVKDNSGCYLLVNSAATQIFQKPKEEIIGKNSYQIFPAEVATKLSQKEQQTINDYQQQIIRETFQVKGREKSYLTTIKPWNDEQGNIVGIVGISQEDPFAIENSTNLLHTVIESIPETFYVKDIQGRYVLINSVGVANIGKTVSDFIGKDDTEIFPLEFARQLQENDRQIMNTGEPQIIEETVNYGNHQQVFLSRKNVWRDSQGNIIGLVGFTQDITTQKLQEVALKQQARILDQLYDSVVTTDLNGIVTRWNKAAERLYGYSATEAIGQSVTFLYPPEEQEHFATKIIPALQQQGVYEGELKSCRKGGEILDIFINISWENNEQGEVVGMIGYAIDITERKRIEEERRRQEIALRKSEELSRTLIEHIPNGSVFLFDRDRRFLIAGGSELTKVGLSPADLEGKFPHDIWPPNEYQLFDRFSQAALAGQMLKDEISYYNTVYLAQAVPVKNSSGEIFAGLLIVQNITERKQAESAIEESANRLELLNRIAGQIRASLDLDTILETVVTSIRELFEIDACTFVWYVSDNYQASEHENFFGSLNNSGTNSGQTETAVWQAVKEARNPSLPSFLGIYTDSLLQPISGKSLQQEIIIVDDTEAVSDPTLKQLLESFNCLSLLTVPFQTNGGKVGFLSCSHHSSKRAWKETEIELILGIADNLAIAISQAELYQNSQNSAKIASERALQLEKALQDLQRTQTQLIQSEKMSSLGQLVAGVAHEINNPVSFIYGNIKPAQEYISDLLELVELYQTEYPQPTAKIQSQIELIDLDFLMEDVPKILDSMKVGAERIREIVLSLRNFSRMDEAQIKNVCIHDGIDSTLRLLQNRLKAKPEHPEILVVKNYGQLPLVECYAGQLNQVFMNLLTNAIDALEERNKKRSLTDIKAHPSQIEITTKLVDSGQIAITFKDNGPGMSPEIQARIFDPFFTTKPVGQGTGLGLAISYQVVVEKHLGNLRCHSVSGEGTNFTVEIPIKQKP